MRVVPRSRNGKIGVAVGLTAMVVGFVGAWEGYKPKAYPDIVGVWTICYGETKNVKPGQVMTKAQCDAQLVESLIEHENGMLRCVTRPMPDPVHAAMLSLTYNVGVGAFCKSTAARLANAGDWWGACTALKRFVMAGGRRVQGLVNRREAEYKICIQGLK